MTFDATTQAHIHKAQDKVERARKKVYQHTLSGKEKNAHCRQVKQEALLRNEFKVKSKQQHYFRMECKNARYMME